MSSSRARSAPSLHIPPSFPPRPIPFLDTLHRPSSIFHRATIRRNARVSRTKRHARAPNSKANRPGPDLRSLDARQRHHHHHRQPPDKRHPRVTSSFDAGRSISDMRYSTLLDGPPNVTGPIDAVPTESRPPRPSTPPGGRMVGRRLKLQDPAGWKRDSSLTFPVGRTHVRCKEVR